MPVRYIEALENDNSRLAKEAVLERAWEEGCVELFEGFALAYDSMITFGVKKVPEIIECDDEEGTFSHADFLSLAEKLRTRQLTGNAARDALRDAAEVCHALTWNKFYRRILLKDLRCGVSDTTVNKVLKKLGKKDKNALNYLIDKFELQLSVAEELENITGTVLIDPKLDGVRIVAIMDKDTETVTMFTRNGKENTNFDHIENSLKKLFPHLPGSIVLDGEMISRSFQDLMRQVHRKQKVNTLDARFGVFDILPLSDFKKGICNIPLSERHDTLSALECMFQEFCRVTLADGNEVQNVFVIPKLEVDLDTDEGKRNLFEFNAQTLQAGYEGVMIKMPDSPYERKRTKSWLKVKPIIEVTLKIVDIEEGTGRNVGRMGNFICEGADLGYKIRVSVGSGFSDEEREQFWVNKDKLLGEMVEIVADTITKDQSDDEWFSLRFPRFKTFRGFEPGEKI